jgi:hypothetical protein
MGTRSGMMFPGFQMTHRDTNAQRPAHLVQGLLERFQSLVEERTNYPIAVRSSQRLTSPFLDHTSRK